MSVVIKSRLGLIAEEAIPKAQAAVTKASLDIEMGAKSRSRVDTGNMRASIAARPAGALEAMVEAGAEYTIYNEYGTSKMSAQPMLRPATEQARGGFYAAMRQVFS